VTENHGDRVVLVPPARDFRPPPQSSIQVLVVVEGKHDIHFLRRVSRILHTEHDQLPDLGAWEEAGCLLFVPTAGGAFLTWAERPAGLGLPEFHLYDREIPPETELRMRAPSSGRDPGGPRALAVVEGCDRFHSFHGPGQPTPREVPAPFGSSRAADASIEHCQVFEAG
jgi:hypothetical protein